MVIVNKEIMMMVSLIATTHLGQCIGKERNDNEDNPPWPWWGYCCVLHRAAAPRSLPGHLELVQHTGRPRAEPNLPLQASPLGRNVVVRNQWNDEKMIFLFCFAADGDKIVGCHKGTKSGGKNFIYTCQQVSWGAMLSSAVNKYDKNLSLIHIWRCRRRG